MALTALDPHTGSVVFPYDNGCNRASCRDSNCQAALIAVRESKHEEATIRRAHWRHQVKVKCSTTRRTATSKETPWHVDWKMQCNEIERIEYRHIVRRGLDSVSVRTADVWTKFSWALEFQHSAISQLEVRRRENHYQGKVIWVVDCASRDNANGAFDTEGSYIRWHAAPHWVTHTRALLAIDDGNYVYLLPPNFSEQLTTNRERIFLDSVVIYEHESWVRLWINGDCHPLGGDFASQWTLDRRERAKNRELNRQMQTMIEVSYRRAQYGLDKCSFRGDRNKLVFIEDRLFEVRMCQFQGCVSAASSNGTCYAHWIPEEIS